MLIVDDDESAHDVARLQFKRVKICKKRVRILSAFSAKEALDVLAKNPDTSLMIVDIVMESDHAGLDLVDSVRTKLKNESVRIVVRSGYIDLVKEYVAGDFAKKYNVSSIADKVEVESSLIDLVHSEIKKYKVSKSLITILKIFLVKISIDWIKKMLN